LGEETGRIAYELLYSSNGLEKGIYGEGDGDDVVEGRFEKTLFVGMCSGEDCIFDIVDGNRFLVKLEISDGEVVNLEKETVLR